MSTDELDDAILARFVGWIDAGIAAPTFIIPVFQDMDNDQIVVQTSSNINTICNFMSVPNSYNKNPSKNTIVKKFGSKILFGILLQDGSTYFDEIENFTRRLSSLLLSGEFKNFPAFALNVAKFINDVSQIDSLTKELFSSVLNKSRSSKKYFLENDVVRESLYRSTRSDRHSFVQKMRINISGNKISLGLPPSTPEQFRQEFGQQITNIYKNFTDSSIVEVSFQEKDDEAEIERIKTIEREISQIKSGRYPINPEILDLPFIADYFSPREAIVVVPEAANLFIESRLTRSQVVRMIVSKKFHRRPISESTAQRIVSLEPVSLLSVMLFRLWVLPDVAEHNYSAAYAPHICCFAVKREIHESFYKSKNFKDFFNKKNPPPFFYVFPMSLIYLMVESNFISDQDAREAFEFRRGGLSVFYYLDSKNIKKWTEFSISDFPHLSKKLAREIFDADLQERMI